GGVDGIGFADLVAEIGGPAIADAAQSNGGADSSFGIVRPDDAAGGGVEGENFASAGADKESTAGDGGLRVGSQSAGDAEGPFQFEFRDVGDGEARRGRDAAIVG